MNLNSYDCELCLLQKEEMLHHLFFTCPFAKNCWNQIGVLVPSWLKPERATRHIKRAHNLPFAMEVIILMSWCIWSERNSWLFGNEDPSPQKCKRTCLKEFAMVIHRVKPASVSAMEEWIHSIV
jgi:hypothetical protein